MTAMLLAAVIGLNAACADSNNSRVEAKKVTFEATQPNAFCSISVDEPVCNNPRLRSQLMKYIIDELEIFTYEDTQPLMRPDFDSMTVEEIVKDYATAKAEMLSKEKTNTDKDDEGVNEDPRQRSDWIENLYINLMADSTQYVSYLVEGSSFTGGIHGSYWFRTATINKNNGQVLANIFRPDAQEKIQQMLWKRLTESRGEEEDKEVFRRSIEEYLEYSYGQKDVLPLPKAEPMLTPTGIVLQYQSYEICNFAMGAPQLTFTTEEALPFLSDEAARLLQDQ